MDSSTADLTDRFSACTRQLAQDAQITDRQPGRPDVLNHLDELEQWFSSVLVASREPKPGFDLAANWILDNDYQVVRAFRHIRKDLPVSFYRNLPSLSESQYAALPRAYLLIHVLLGETRLQLTYQRLVEFITAYQNHAPLTEAELWAVPALLRIACIENLVSGVTELLADQSRPFTASRIATDNTVTDATERVSGAIASLVTIGEINWHDFVDEVSQVEARLSDESAGVYPRMSRATRNAYRRNVEMLARFSLLSELQVVDTVLQLSRESGEVRSQHVGYWLMDVGRDKLERQVGYRPPVRERLVRMAENHATALYLSLLCAITAAGLILPLWYLQRHGASPVLLLSVLGLSLIPATDFAVQFVHWWTPQLKQRRGLSSFDRHRLNVETVKCAVAVPVIVGSVDEVAKLIEKLELRYLANTESYLRFVLLSDPADANHEKLPDDHLIERALVEGIRTLNARYPHRQPAHPASVDQDAVGEEAGNSDSPLAGSSDRFLLLHRARQYNDAEGCWMAWERKRGKIEQFNALLVDGWSAPFVLTEGDLSQIHGVKYVISLDADTMLPPGTAADLVCAFEHPLNQPLVDRETGRVVAGYTILQPRVETLETGESSSRFAQLFSGDRAIDIYSHTVSDFHQDWFGTGNYVGKGIYHVESFYQSLDGRVPENRILSHDLFEGLHGRVALASNIILYESFPETWTEHCSRQHRWIRGDWQLLSWLGHQVPAGAGLTTDSVFRFVDRWKLLDNLRRSLVQPVLFVYLLGAWFWFPGNPLFWTVLALGACAPTLANEAVVGARLVSGSGEPRGYLHQIKQQLIRWVVTVTLIVPEALISLDAIVKALWRQWVSGRHLLQWRSSAHARYRVSSNAVESTAFAWLVWLSPVSAVLVLVFLFKQGGSTVLPAMPILIAWLIAPRLVSWLSEPQVFRRDTLNGEDQRFLRRAARRTWHYFESFAGPEDNWLPPDNFQSHATLGIAHRTSPTNIGLYLCSAVAATDLGFIGAAELEVRARNVLDTVDHLPLHRKQLLNWYDTQSLEPLEPRYVSTVDNGNLALCLLALKQGCVELSRSPLLSVRRWQGLADTFDLMCSSVNELDTPVSREAREQIDSLQRRLTALCEHDSELDVTLFRYRTLAGWSVTADVLNQTLAGCSEAEIDKVMQVRTWMERFDHQLSTLFRDIHTLIPWLLLLDDVPESCLTLQEQLVAQLKSGYPLYRFDDTYRLLHASVQEASAELSDDVAAVSWLDRLDTMLDEAWTQQSALSADILSLASRAGSLAWSMDFKWLYDRRSRLFHIGYNVSSGLLDNNHYDLLASEARIASFFAIAKHDVPLEHWFQLGRPIIRHGTHPVLQSWNGSMFEYLMPPLFLPGRRDTLIGESESLAVMAQQQHAKRLNLPWGVSESAYAVTDADGNFQYKAFGVPSLGIRRGLAEDYVVAPYASMLALAVWPKAAVANLRRLESLQAMGEYGFIDALDFTATRLYPRDGFRAVDTWMAHHQGMSMISIVNVLQADTMPRRVFQEPALKAVELLLQERIPWGAPTEPGRLYESSDSDAAPWQLATLSPWSPIFLSTTPQLQVLGNGSLSARVSSQGGGGLFYKDLAVTRVSADRIQAHSGYRIHVHDDTAGLHYWVGGSPDGLPGVQVNSTFSQHGVEIAQRVADLTVRLDMLVAPYDDLDVRRLTLINESSVEREISVTSYAEVVLASPADDQRHPAFSKLFVGSRQEPELNGVSFVRRPRETHAHTPVLLHRLVSDDEGVELSGYDTDRHHWFGRKDRSLKHSCVPASLSETTGWTLDPIMALRISVSIPAGQTRRFCLVTIMAEERRLALEKARRYGMPALERLFADAPWSCAQQIHQLGLDDSTLPHLQRLVSLLLYPHSALRVFPELSAGNDPDVALAEQSELWRVGLSGDLPLLMVRIHDVTAIGLLETLVRAQALWRQRGFPIDIGVLRMSNAGYEDPLRERVMEVLRDTHNSGWLGRKGGVHLLSVTQLSQRSQQKLLCAASVVLDTDRSLPEQLEQLHRVPPRPPHLIATGPPVYPELAQKLERDHLLLEHDLGGFDEATGEYVIHLEAGKRTPAPWCNILANERFGTMISESGLGCTWAQNSGEHRLTPWMNDPVCDPQVEQLWLRDEVSTECWTITPRREEADCVIQARHGFGHTRWLRNSHGLEQELMVLVPVHDPVKILRVSLVNRSTQVRRITATYYAQWVMEAMLAATGTHVLCTYDAERQAIIARNHWNSAFKGSVAFVTASLPPHSVCGDRTDFLNPQSASTIPEGMTRSDLGGRFTPGADSCAAFQVHLDIAPQSKVECVFLLGEGANLVETQTLIDRWKGLEQVESALKDVAAFWDKSCGAIKVRTPDVGFDLLINGWLQYQVVSSRLHARAGFYQAGGAYGFRDQLQDVLACLPSDPARVRNHLLLAAAHQFEEGDVLHWWHPPEDRGVRTRISDDYLWLVYVTARYIHTTGDRGVLEALIPYLNAPPLTDEEEDRYATYESGCDGTLFDHCCRAIEHGMRVGEHGLPLIGAGDWNDGMDRIGNRGRGESVWLAWFRIATLKLFIPIADERGESELVTRWQNHVSALKLAVDAGGWDGRWYARAFDDQGIPWGSMVNDECQIDVIAQAWGALAGYAGETRVISALQAAYERLVDREHQIVRLLTPPFHDTPRNPGYIKSYPPGIRENGGQYTHAAAWLGLAFVASGEADKAFEVFSMINPLNHTRDQQALERYAREPYVLSADIGGAGLHMGRGGWSWYTGAASWTWQLGVHGILGIAYLPGAVQLKPAIPSHWNMVEVMLDSGQSLISLRIERDAQIAHGKSRISVDGQQVLTSLVEFPAPEQVRRVVVQLPVNAHTSADGMRIDSLQ